MISVSQIPQIISAFYHPVNILINNKVNSPVNKLVDNKVNNPINDPINNPINDSIKDIIDTTQDLIIQKEAFDIQNNLNKFINEVREIKSSEIDEGISNFITALKKNNNNLIFEYFDNKTSNSNILNSTGSNLSQSTNNLDSVFNHLKPSDIFMKFKESADILKYLPNSGPKMKIFGELGEYTLNELAEKAANNMQPVLDLVNAQATPNLGVIVGIITPFFLYARVVKLYNNITDNHTRFKFINERVRLLDDALMRREKIFFMLVAAPAIVLSLYTIGLSVLKPKLEVSLNIDKQSTASSLLTPSQISSIQQSFFNLFFFRRSGNVSNTNKFYSSKVQSKEGLQKKNNKWWSIIKLIITLALIFLLYWYGFISFGAEQSNFFKDYIKTLNIIGIVLSFIGVIYYIFNMCMFILFLKKKLTIPKILPLFFYDWLKLLKDYSEFEDKHRSNLLNYYYKCFLLCLLFLCLGLIQFYFL